MKNEFVEDGYHRFIRARKAVTFESLQKKYAVELAKAGPFRKLQIRKRMLQEYLRRGNEGHQPSPGTLW